MRIFAAFKINKFSFYVANIKIQLSWKNLEFFFCLSFKMDSKFIYGKYILLHIATYQYFLKINM